MSGAATMRFEDLRKRWDERTASHSIVAEMAFSDGFLVLGAGTRLTKIGDAVDVRRLAALLTAAHGKPIENSRLKHVRRAVETWRDGKAPLALTHLALSGLSKLAQPREGAWRLFLAESLLGNGVPPGTIVAGLTGDTDTFSPLATKYSPDQPRVPAGNANGGQWTGEDPESSAAPQRRAERREPNANLLGLVLPDGCDEEWAKARKICIDLFDMPDPPRWRTGGHTTVEGCAKGSVSQRCGGNPVV